MSKVIHVLAMAGLFVTGCAITGGALTPADATVYGIPLAIMATVTMQKTGWYFCD